MFFLVRSSCSHHIQHERDYYNNVEKDGYAPYIYPHPYTFDKDIDDDVDGMDLALLALNMEGERLIGFSEFFGQLNIR